MPWLRTQTEFEMEDEDVSLSSVQRQTGSRDPGTLRGPCQSSTTPSVDRMSKAEAHYKNRADRCQPGTSLGSNEIIPAKFDAVSRQYRVEAATLAVERCN
jgi:hypothetical protein